MFQIFIMYINLDIQIIFGIFYRIFWFLGLSVRVQFCNTLQDSFGLFYIFDRAKIWVFGSGFMDFMPSPFLGFRSCLINNSISFFFFFLVNTLLNSQSDNLNGNYQTRVYFVWLFFSLSKSSFCLTTSGESRDTSSTWSSLQIFVLEIRKTCDITTQGSWTVELGWINLENMGKQNKTTQVGNHTNIV